MFKPPNLRGVLSELTSGYWPKLLYRLSAVIRYRRVLNCDIGVKLTLNNNTRCSLNRYFERGYLRQSPCTRMARVVSSLQLPR
jgi:hypothetical protein